MSQGPLPLSIDYASRSTSDLRHPYANTALLLAAVGLAVPPLGAAAIWLGRLSRRFSYLGGVAPARRANWAIALGAIALAAQLTGGSIYAVHAIDVSRKARCAANLEAIGQAMMLYTNENRGAMPLPLAVLHRFLAKAGTTSVFVCPAGDSHAVAGPFSNDVLALRDRELDYVWADARSKLFPNPMASWKRVIAYEREPILIERLSNHGIGSNILFADGKVRFVDRDAVLNLADKALKSGQIDQASYDAIVGK